MSQRLKNRHASPLAHSLTGESVKSTKRCFGFDLETQICFEILVLSVRYSAYTLDIRPRNLIFEDTSLQLAVS